MTERWRETMDAMYYDTPSGFGQACLSRGAGRDTFHSYDSGAEDFTVYSWGVKCTAFGCTSNGWYGDSGIQSLTVLYQHWRRSRRWIVPIHHFLFRVAIWLPALLGGFNPTTMPG